MMAKGISQKALAEKMGKKESQVSRQLGGANITLDTLFELADAVGEEVEIHVGTAYRNTAWAMVQVADNPLIAELASSVFLTIEDQSNNFGSDYKWDLASGYKLFTSPCEKQLLQAPSCEDVSFIELAQITFQD